MLFESFLPFLLFKKSYHFPLCKSSSIPSGSPFFFGNCFSCVVVLTASVNKALNHFWWKHMMISIGEGKHGWENHKSIIAFMILPLLFSHEKLSNWPALHSLATLWKIINFLANKTRNKNLLIRWSMRSKNSSSLLF